MLCDAEIIEHMTMGNIGIEPFDPAQLNTNSYDVRLGNWFYMVEWREDGPVFKGPRWHDDGDRVHIPIAGTLLGMTKEIVATRNCVVAELRSKSSTRRIGITICDDAGFGDVGYGFNLVTGEAVNPWTCELTAHVQRYGNAHPFLTVGERFAQAVFFKTGKPINEYAGQYSADDWPINMVPKKYRDRVRPWEGAQ